METRTTDDPVNWILSPIESFFGSMQDYLVSLSEDFAQVLMSLASARDAPAAPEEYTFNPIAAIIVIVLVVLTLLVVTIGDATSPMAERRRKGRLAQRDELFLQGSSEPDSLEEGGNTLNDDEDDIECNNKHCTCAYHEAEAFVDGKWDFAPCTNPNCACTYHYDELFDEELNRWVDAVKYVV